MVVCLSNEICVILREDHVITPSSYKHTLIFHAFVGHCLPTHVCISSNSEAIFLWRCDPTRVMAPSCLRFLDHTQRRTTVGRTPLDE
jgi:hypothetical protein